MVLVTLQRQKDDGCGPAFTVCCLGRFEGKTFIRWAHPHVANLAGYLLMSKQDKLWLCPKKFSVCFQIKCSKKYGDRMTAWKHWVLSFPSTTENRWIWTLERASTRLFTWLPVVVLPARASPHPEAVQMAETVLWNITQPAGVPVTKADTAEGLSLVTFHPPVWILAFWLLTVQPSGSWLLP